MKIRVSLIILGLYALAVFILNVISDYSIALNKLFLGFGIITVVSVIIALYVKYTIDLIKKLEDLKTEDKSKVKD